MVQSDIYLFLLFSILVISFFYVTPLKWRNLELLISSIFFYILCDYRFVILIIIETFISYFVAKKLEVENNKTNKNNQRDRKRWLIAGVLFVVVILAIFKYFDFFSNVFIFRSVTLIMPIGISYYSFRILSYMVDVYLCRREVEKSIINYAVYVMFFPHLLCGPIARSENFLEQLHKGLKYREGLFCSGLELIICGLFKKIVIADRISAYVALIFKNPESYPAMALWVSAILYSVQLYCDFGGYSDIAIGITNLLGIECESNFMRPYLASDVKMFWKRWHISLSQWLRDYIYIPLGGNRRGKWRHYRNVMITFVICGVWHGSQMHYIVWGVYHGIWNIVTFQIRRKNVNFTVGHKNMKRITDIGKCIMTFLIVTFGWILFRADSIENAFIYTKHMFHGFTINYNAIVQSILPFTGDNSCLAYFICVAVMIGILYIYECFEEQKKKQDSLVWSGIFLLCILLFGTVGGSSFLYANY